MLLSLTRSGLCHSLAIFQDYCQSNDLAIDADKTKILVFSKSWAPIEWQIGDLTFKQVPSFKYLGFLFHYCLNWSFHRKAVINTSRLHLNAIAQFHFSSRNQFIPAALRVFRAKILAQMLYTIFPTWIEAANNALDQVVASFFRRILGVPNLIRLSTLALELGVHLPIMLAWALTFKFWLHLNLNAPPDSLLNDILKDPFFSC